MLLRLADRAVPPDAAERGYGSQFLLLGALDPQEQVQLLAVDGDVPPGTPLS